MRLAVAGACAALLLCVFAEAAAQTLTATPTSVDAANPREVLLRVTKPDGSNDAALTQQVKSVKVGGLPAPIKSNDAQGVLITPPLSTPGTTQPLVIYGDADKELARGEIVYQSGGGPSTVDIALRRQEFEEGRREKLVGSNWYYLLVTGMFLAVLVPFVLAIFRGTSGSRATDNRPLGLPVGSFRSILAYSLVAYLGFYVLTSILSVSVFAPPDFLLGIVATVIGFYFGSRSGDDGDVGQKTGVVRGIVRRGSAPVPGAVVKLIRSDDGTEPYSRITDVGGRFEAAGVKPGKYSVSASVANSKPSQGQDVIVSEGSDHEVEIVISDTSGGQQSPAQTGTVQGSVTDPAGHPAPGAQVVLTQAGVEKYKQTTDVGGAYKLDGVAVGDYDATASLPPHASSNQSSVKVSPGGQHVVDLRLK
jgi:hypothetical protein